MAIMIAGLAIGAVGSIASAAGQASAAKAQAGQAEVNRRWQEYETQYNLEQQRGAMGLSEMQRILGQNQFQRSSMEQAVAQRRAIREQTEYANTQFNRQIRSARASANMAAASRGTSRGGTADALERQMDRVSAEDSIRIQQNGQNQIDAIMSRRNAELMNIFGKPQPPKPPTYFPSTPIPQPDTSGMMTGAILSGVGSLVGGIGGVMAANPSSASPGSPGSPEAVPGSLLNTAGNMSYNPSGPMAGIATMNNLGLNFSSPGASGTPGPPMGAPLWGFGVPMPEGTF